MKNNNVSRFNTMNSKNFCKNLDESRKKFREHKEAIRENKKEYSGCMKKDISVTDGYKNFCNEKARLEFKNKLNNGSINGFFDWLINNQHNSEISKMTDNLISKFYEQNNINTPVIRGGVLTTEKKEPSLGEILKKKFTEDCKKSVTENLDNNSTSSEKKTNEVKTEQTKEEHNKKQREELSDFIEQLSNILGSYISDMENVKEDSKASTSEKKVEDNKEQKKQIDMNNILNNMFMAHPDNMFNFDDMFTRCMLTDDFMRFPPVVRFRSRFPHSFFF